MSIITNTLPNQPAAKIIIEGLFILCLNKQQNKIECWAYEHANEHQFFIRVSKKSFTDDSEPGLEGELVRRLDDSDEIHSGDITIAVANRPANISYFQFDSLSEEYFLSDASDKDLEIQRDIPAHASDFRWLIDLEGNRFHKRKIEVIPGVAYRKITIPNGIFYTHRLAKRSVRLAYPQAVELARQSKSQNENQQEENQQEELKNYYVTNQLGIALESLTENEVLSVFYHSFTGRPKNLPLPNLDEGYYYEIYVTNNCASADPRKQDKQSDFQHYYNALNLPVVERFDLKILGGAGDSFLPCDVVFMGQTNSLV